MLLFEPSTLVQPCISLLEEIALPIYSSSLDYNKLQSVIDSVKDRILCEKPLATNCFPNLSPWQVIKECIKEETRRIKAHLFLRKIIDKEKKSAKEVGHFIVHNAIFHQPQAHHFQDHYVLNVFQQMLFVPHGHKGNSPMGSPLYIHSIQTLLGKDKLRIDFTELLLLFKPHDAHVLANDIHGLFFLRCPSHLEDIRL